MYLDYKCRGLHYSPAGENKWYLHCSLDKQSGTISKIDRRKVVEHSSRGKNSFWKMRGVSFLTPPFPFTVFKAREYLTVWVWPAPLWKLWTHPLTATALLLWYSASFRPSASVLLYEGYGSNARLLVCIMGSRWRHYVGFTHCCWWDFTVVTLHGGVSAQGLQEEEDEEEESRSLSWMIDQRLHMWWCSGTKKQNNSRSSFCLLSEVETICMFVCLWYLGLFHYCVLVGQTCKVIKSPALRCLAKISNKWFYLDGFILLDRE